MNLFYIPLMLSESLSSRYSVLVVARKRICRYVDDQNFGGVLPERVEAGSEI